MQSLHRPDALLHDHLDGSRPLLDVLPQLWGFTHSGTKLYPFDLRLNHLEQVKEWFGNPLKGDIVRKFSLTTGVMQDRFTLYEAARTYVTGRAEQGFRYCEATIAPQYHVFHGLTEKQVIESLIRGIVSGEKDHPEIEVNLLLGIGREVSSARAVELAKIFCECDPSYVVGVTLVCNEADNPPEKHRDLFRFLKERKVKKACHADEWVHGENENPDFETDRPKLLKNARTVILDLEIDRGEHFRSLAYDKELMKIVADRGIGISGCPGSYLCSRLLPRDDVGHLRIDELLDNGVLYSINPDDDLFMMDTDEVFRKCHERYKFTEEQKLKLRLNAWKSRFGSRKPAPEDIVGLV